MMKRGSVNTLVVNFVRFGSERRGQKEVMAGRIQTQLVQIRTGRIRCISDRVQHNSTFRKWRDRCAPRGARGEEDDVSAWHLLGMRDEQKALEPEPREKSEIASNDARSGQRSRRLTTSDVNGALITKHAPARPCPLFISISRRCSRMHKHSYTREHVHSHCLISLWLPFINTERTDRMRYS